MRDKYRDEPWYGLAEQFADEWDQTSFDPDYPTEPLSHFEPMVRPVFATPRSFDGAHATPPLAAPSHNRTRSARAELIATCTTRPGTTSRPRYPDVKLSPVVGLICAYEEEDNIGAVLEAMPACGASR